ncbi:Het-C-domain-containing protein [Artomyces pyxidatus]|uniref:Het-C-domain-containing protein n=1 Tax=Artomyces pyxidatus TaxID=48021 RepID=A0ACB8TEX1_9AGAM|nr:Het-C-domain-containing protein [Artomyces pyxidatus]
MAADRRLFLLLLVFLVVCLPGNEVLAFGAGNIPSFAYMEGRAFRHGDIEDTLSEVAKKSGGFALGALIGKGGSKFGGLDIKRVYFGVSYHRANGASPNCQPVRRMLRRRAFSSQVQGAAMADYSTGGARAVPPLRNVNWLRDYSQAVDIAGLKKLQLQTIINLCMALGFLAFGYATHEFEVTEERLGVYLPTEHIDNPKGYGEGEDARTYDKRLRGPVDPRELEVDPRTGMKNYIANESGNWDTSKALVRRTLERCIHLGRQHRSQGRKQDEYEAYRLLGQALHTLEDFSAHSNFCELALVSMGHTNVFVHVGDGVRIQAPNGKWVAPLVTGTFGSSDFIYSLLGEATDHISEASVSDLNKALDSARSRSTTRGINPTDTLRDLLLKVPGGSGSEMSRDLEGIERIRDGPSQGGKSPDQMTPQELHAVLWQVLSFRDSVVKKIEKTIEKIPGLGPLIEKLMDSISVFVFTTLEPFLKPILSTASSQLSTASGEVINKHDQYEVFNDPHASDPTHSFLSKDHFNLILNEPAGNCAKIVVKHTVNLVTKAWDDTSVNLHHTIEEILQCIFHPDFHHSSSTIQRELLAYMQTWVQSHGHKSHEMLNRLSKQAVRNHENVRQGGEGGPSAAAGTFAANAGLQTQANLQGYIHQIPGVAQAQGLYNQFGGGGGPRRDVPGGPGMQGMPGMGTPSTGPPPIVSAASRPGGGQAADYYGDGAAPPPPAPHIPPSSYAGGSPSVGQSSYVGGSPSVAHSSYPGTPPPPSHSPHPAHHAHHAHGHEHRHATFPDPSGPPQSSYAAGARGFPDAGGPPSFPGHVQSSYPGQTPSTYPGQTPSSYPGQSTYPGQAGGGVSMPGESYGAPGGAPPYGPPGGAPPYGSSYGGGGPGYPPPGGPPGFPGAEAWLWIRAGKCPVWRV